MNLLHKYLSGILESGAVLYPIVLIETMRVNKKSIPLWIWHRNRLSTSLDFIKVKDAVLPQILSDIEKQLHIILEQQCNSDDNYKLRLELQLKKVTHYEIVFTLEPIKSLLHHVPYNVVTFERTIPTQPYMALKCDKRSQYLIAERYMTPDIDNVILLYNNNVVDALNGNVMLWKNNILYTSALESGCVGGTMLQYIIDNKDELSFDVQIQSINLSDLENADTVWITNGLRGIVPVMSINGRKMSYQIHEADKIKTLNSLYFL